MAEICVGALLDGNGGTGGRFRAVWGVVRTRGEGYSWSASARAGRGEEKTGLIVG